MINTKQKRRPDDAKRNDEILEFTQDFIPIKEIKNGIVETTDGRFIKILEIESGGLWPLRYFAVCLESSYPYIGQNLH